MNQNLFTYLISEYLNRKKSKSSRLMLLETTELPGEDWKVAGKRTWRTGSQLRKSNEISRRAFQAGTYTAWRGYKQTAPTERSLWIQVSPYATEGDAKAEVPNLRAHFVMSDDPKSKVTEEREVDNEPIPGVEITFVYEQMTLGRQGPGIARYAAGNVDHIIFVVACFSYGGDWSWNEVTTIASTEAGKIRATIAGQVT